MIDAAAVIVAVEKGFTRAEGLDVKLVREVSWSNVRDKLNIGLFDGAHILAPIPIASSLGLGHIKVPVIAPLTLNLNGNAITVSATLHAAIMAEIDGDPFRSDGDRSGAIAGRRDAAPERRRAADLRHDVSVFDPQLPATLLDGRGRRRSG